MFPKGGEKFSDKFTLKKMFPYLKQILHKKNISSKESEQIHIKKNVSTFNKFTSKKFSPTDKYFQGITHGTLPP